MHTRVNVNGEIVGEQDAVISVFDHGFLYGEGVYEMLPHLPRAAVPARPAPAPAARVGQPHRAAGAVHRRRRSPAASRTRSTAAELSDPAGPDAYIRMLLTRGVGELTYDPSACPPPSLVIIVKPLAPPPRDVYDHGIRVVARVDRAQPPGVGQPADQVEQPAEQRARDAGGDPAGRVRSGDAQLPRRARPSARSRTSSWCAAATALTPPLDAGPARRASRASSCSRSASAIGVPMAEATLRDEDLLGADEAFLTSTTREVVPIVRVDAAPDRHRPARPDHAGAARGVPPRGRDASPAALRPSAFSA